MTPRVVLQTSIGIFLAALGIRTFVLLGVVVPIEVSASSMAPSLLGPHRMAVCDACGNEFPVGIDHGRMPRRATCPSCGKREIGVSRFPAFAGDAIWIDRTAFLVMPPRRWDVVVFRCPNNATRFCVKRIVGMPGEVIEIEGGDVLANGQVALPPPAGVDGFLPRYERSPEVGQSVSGRSPWRLGPGEYFVLGDNSRVSDDSRTWRSGPGLARKLLVGKPLRAAW